MPVLLLVIVGSCHCKSQVKKRTPRACLLGALALGTIYCKHDGAAAWMVVCGCVEWVGGGVRYETELCDNCGALCIDIYRAGDVL